MKHTMKHLLRRLMATFLLLSAFSCVFAQHERIHSTMIGGGSASIYDTYLSPYTYKGGTVHILRETRRELQHPLIHIDGLTFQTLLDVDASFVKSPAKNVEEYAGGARYSLAWLYRLPFFDKTGDTASSPFDLHVGPAVSGYLGGIYNDRNGNNPGQAKADLMVDITAMGQYRFRLLNRNCNLRYQVTFPFFGIAFSPNYGQSYYEAFVLEQRDHNVVFANFANMPSMRHLLTFDIPIRPTSRTTLRIGYAGQFMQSTFNNLRYHSYTHSFMIGLTQTLNRL